MTSEPPRPPAPTLPAHIEETLQAIARLHIEHRRGSVGLQETVERITRFLSRARAVALLAAGVAAWIGLNVGVRALGGPWVDPPPFLALQSLTGVAALFTTLLILVTQRREDELSELRQQLTLELAMLTEQKTAKLIELVEELRRDLPDVRDRHDGEAASLARPADPEAVFDVLKEHQAGARGDAPEST